MAIFDSSQFFKETKDIEFLAKVKYIFEKYKNAEFNEELVDAIMNETKIAFGDNVAAKVMIDDETKEIEITVPDNTGSMVTMSSLRH